MMAIATATMPSTGPKIMNICGQAFFFERTKALPLINRAAVEPSRPTNPPHRRKNLRGRRPR